MLVLLVLKWRRMWSRRVIMSPREKSGVVSLKHWYNVGRRLKSWRQGGHGGRSRRRTGLGWIAVQNVTKIISSYTTVPGTAQLSNPRALTWTKIRVVAFRWIVQEKIKKSEKTHACTRVVHRWKCYNTTTTTTTTFFLCLFLFFIFLMMNSFWFFS